LNKAQYITEVLLKLREPESPIDPLHRPVLFCPGLTEKPWYDSQDFDWVRSLEKQTNLFQKELDTVNSNSHPLKEYREPIHNGKSYRILHDSGQWNVAYFYFEEKRFDHTCLQFPNIAKFLDQFPRRTGLACLSKLDPHTHIKPHCGYFNFILRAHLALEIPSNNCEMRVGNDTRKWIQGECSIFDDTYEHEVWNKSNTSRTVLMFDFFHPELTNKEIEALRRLWRQPQARQQINAWVQIIENS